MDDLYVQFGCGLCAPIGWLNFDASPTLRLQRLPLFGRYFMRVPYPLFPANVKYGDIVKGLPISAESCKGIYSSHTLEHFALNDFRSALKNTYAYLQSGGVFRFVIPDLGQLITNYVNSHDLNKALVFVEHTGLGRKSRPQSLAGFLREWLGTIPHLWMWDYPAIKIELERIGFNNIRRAQFGDAVDERFSEVELSDRWAHCLGVECIK